MYAGVSAKATNGGRQKNRYELSRVYQKQKHFYLKIAPLVTWVSLEIYGQGARYKTVYRTMNSRKVAAKVENKSSRSCTCLLKFQSMFEKKNSYNNLILKKVNYRYKREK